MDNINVDSHDISVEQQCTKCKEHEADIEAYQILLLIITFIGPIIGILVGLFARRKLKS
ncbi:MAG: hypothetical protein FWC93_03070 [Defluviitaleaceae bacterium]|nr:hypothetical protein [Defluviitaleaceae bacterium]